jgi:hypothetical protein
MDRIGCFEAVRLPDLEHSFGHQRDIPIHPKVTVQVSASASHETRESRKHRHASRSLGQPGKPSTPGSLRASPGSRSTMSARRNGQSTVTRSREITVYAAGQRAKLADLRALARVIDCVFSRYGYAHSPKFLPHLPTGIDMRHPSRCLPTLIPLLRDGFLAAARIQTRETVLRACRFMESYPNEPFERTKHEVLGAMGESPSGDAARDAGSGGDGPPTDDDLRRWWGLVMEAEHVEIERELVLRG